jgi:hypothetical protein
MEISFTTLAQEQQLAINLCGTPCVGDCQTCVQSNADLDAFYGLAVAEPATVVAVPEEPIEVQVMAPAGDEEPEDQALEVARGMDALEEAQRSGEAYEDDGDDDDGYRGCQCLDCLNHDDENYIPSYYDRDYDDGGYGLDWNESGYFD